MTAARGLADALMPGWEQQVERALQPAATYLQEQVSQRLQSELDRMSAILERDRERVLGSVRDALADQVAALLADLQQRRVPRQYMTRAMTPNRQTSAPATTAAVRTSGGQPARPRAPKRPSLGQPPPGPARKRSPSAPSAEPASRPPPTRKSS